jgi:hypothetical protein
MPPRAQDSTPALPHNPKAESAVLGAAMLNAESLDSVLHTLVPSDFFDQRHQHVYRALIAMREKQLSVDLVTLCEFMGAEKTLGLADGAAYLSHLIDGVPTIANIEQYVTIVQEKARLRSLLHHAQAIQQAALEPGANPEELETRFKAITPTATNGNGHALRSYPLSEFLTTQFPTREHLVEGVLPRGGSIMIVALPHRLKSWFTMAMALSCTREGIALGKLKVSRPVRTLLLQLEEFPGELQKRLQSLVLSPQFRDCDSSMIRIVPRCDFHLPNDKHFAALLREVKDFGADHVVFDVVRRVFRGDINSPKDSALFLEQVDGIREETDCAATLVHHENKKGEEIMTAAAGSYNFSGWAKVMIKFSRKSEEQTPQGPISQVEIEVDNSYAPSPEPMRMVLNLSVPQPVRLEALEEGTGFREAMEQLSFEWTVKDLAEALGIHKANAYRRVKKWLADGKIDRVRKGNRGRTGGMARYQSLDPLDELSKS